jgi:hypothetical protein
MRKLILHFTFVIPAFASYAQQSDIYQKLEAISIIDQKVIMPMREDVRFAFEDNFIDRL